MTAPMRRSLHTFPTPAAATLRRSLLALLLLVTWPAFAAQMGAAAAPESPGAAGAAATEDAAPLVPDVVADVLPSGDDPETLADEAVRGWLARPAADLATLLAMETVAMCEALPALVLAPPPPSGTRVNLDDRRALPVTDETRRSYTYSAVRPQDQLDVVQVDLVRDGEAWQVTYVGFRPERAGTGRAFLATPTTGALFLGISLLVLVLVLRPASWVRRGLARGLDYVREHRRLVIVTMTLLYASFGLGVLSGSALPPACEDAVLVVLDQALGQVGATPAVLAGDPVRLAVTIFYQNFGVVTLLLFWLGLLFGLPAYLLAVPQFFANGLPFGVLYQATGPLALLGTLLLIVIELTAYFLVVAGGGMLLVTLVRRGFAAFPLAISKTGHMLLIAGVLLLVGAWYEVGLILLR
jgi:hypothetical protein